MKKFILLVGLVVGLCVLVVSQPSPSLLPNGWLTGTVLPLTCSSGTSPYFYNQVNSLVYSCVANLYTTTGGSRRTNSIEGNLTAAQLHAAPVIVTPITGQYVKIIGFTMQAKGGAAATCTSVQFVDTTGTPVVGVQVNQAQLTQDTIINEATGSVVLTTFQTSFAIDKGLAIRDVGGQCTTMTSLNYMVLYKHSPTP
jgi:hypothetical protein